MAKMIQFEGGEFEGRDPRNPACIECEASLMDALDGILSPAEQARFDAHIATCATCSQMLEEAQRGSAWLSMLRTPRPEPSAALLEKILAQTSGAEAVGQSESIPEWVAPAWAGYNLPVRQPEPKLATNVIRFRQRFAAGERWQNLRYHLLQPRLAMTAAMAFFSVALTLNLTGVKLNQLHASDLTPTGIRRGFYDASASAARYYGNLKVVYVMESRLEDIRRSHDDDEPVRLDRSSPAQAAPQSDPQPAQSPDQQPDQNSDQQQKKPAPNGGTSRLREPLPIEPKAHFQPIAGASSSDSPSGFSKVPAARAEYGNTGGE